MTVSSYIYQSPYPSSMQMGRPDPAAQQQNNSQVPQESTKPSSSVPNQSTVNPTLGNQVTIDLIALAGSEGQQAASTYQAANAKVQAQSAYQSS